MIRYKDVMKKLEDHLKDITLEQLNKELDEAGLNFYAVEKQPDCSPSALNNGLGCDALREDKSCGLSDDGCEQWRNWDSDNRVDEPAEYFCHLSRKVRDTHSR